MKCLTVALSFALMAVASVSNVAQAATDSMYSSTEPKALECFDIVRQVRNSNTSAQDLERALANAQQILSFYREARGAVAAADYDTTSKDVVALKWRESECAEALQQALTR